MRAIITIIVLAAVFIPSVVAEVEWDEGSTYTLSWRSPSFIKSGYTFTVYDFDGHGSVQLNMTKNNVQIATIVLTNKRENWTYNNIIRLQAWNVTDEKNLSASVGLWPLDPQAEITIYLAKDIEKAPPAVSIDIVLDKNEYSLDEMIPVVVNLEGVGNDPTRDTNLNISVDGMQVIIGDTQYSYGTLEKNNTRAARLTLQFPAFPDKPSYRITANVTWKGLNDSFRYATYSEFVKIAPPIELRKMPPSDPGLGDSVSFTISARNLLNRQVHAAVNDVLPNYFRFTNKTPFGAVAIPNSTSMTWEFDLAPGEKKEVMYWAVPMRAGTLSIEPATVKWNLWGGDMITRSNSGTVLVHGPFILLTKTLNTTSLQGRTSAQKVKVGDKVQVYLKIENIGDLPVKAKIFDPLPEFAGLLAGNQTLEDTLMPGEVKLINYTMVITDTTLGEHMMPAPVVKLIATWPLIEAGWTKEKYEKAYEVLNLASVSMLSEPSELPTATPVRTRATPPPVITPTAAKEDDLTKLRDVLLPGFEGFSWAAAVLVVFILMRMKRGS